MQGLLDLITNLGPIAVILVIFAESGLMAGFFLPGDSLLFVAGTLVNRELFHINIVLFIILLFIAAVAGNTSGYYIGKKLGRKLFRRPDSRFFRQEYLRQAEKFYEEHGHKAIVIAMFIPIVRAFTPVVGGIAHMPYRTFISYNIIGAALWTSSFTLIGYFAGGVIEKLGINIEITALLIIAISLIPGVIHILKEPENRAKIRQKVRTSASKIKNAASVKRRKTTPKLDTPVDKD